VSTAALFAPFPHVRLATEADQPALSDFHRQIAMKTKLFSLAYDYDKTALLEPNTFVTLFEDEGRIQGTASLSCRRTDVGTRYGYLGNLRIAPRMSSGVRKEWRHFYGALVAQARSLDEAGNPEFLLTSILDDNHLAIRFLTKHLPQVRYVPVQKYESVTTFGPTLFARRAVRGVSFRREGERVIGERNGKIVACVTPRQSPNRTLLITEAAWPVRRALKAVNVNVPGPVKLTYLTQLRVDPGADRAQIFEAMSYFVWHHFKPVALCFATFPGVDEYDLRRWVRLRTKGTLYEVTTRDSAPSPVLQRAAATGPLPFDLSNS